MREQLQKAKRDGFTPPQGTVNALVSEYFLDEIAPSDRACQELHRVAGVHSRALREAEVLARSACYRPLTIDGVPLIGPVPGAPGAYVATGHASWGILNAPATGRMVSEMVLDGASHSVDASPFAVSRLPVGRI